MAGIFIYETSGRTGAVDELTVHDWDDTEIDFSIPEILNNTAGTRYLFVQHQDLSWSNGFGFELIYAAEALSIIGSVGALAVSSLRGPLNSSSPKGGSLRSSSLRGTLN